MCHLFKVFLLVAGLAYCGIGAAQVRTNAGSIPLKVILFNTNKSQQASIVEITSPSFRRSFSGEVHPIRAEYAKSSDSINNTGHYTIHVTYFPDSSAGPKQFETSFELEGTEKEVQISVEILHERDENLDGQVTYHNCRHIYLNKFYGNKYNVTLKRLWNPQAQFNAGEELIPNYEWVNNSDSMIYGVYWPNSSRTIAVWACKWDIGFMALQKDTLGTWKRIMCNAPRIHANLKKGATGTTLQDIAHIYSKKQDSSYTKNQKQDDNPFNKSHPAYCETKLFNRHSHYRVIIQYCINDAITRTIPATALLEECQYYETHICAVTDEFMLWGKQ